MMTNQPIALTEEDIRWIKEKYPDNSVQILKRVRLRLSETPRDDLGTNLFQLVYQVAQQLAFEQTSDVNRGKAAIDSRFSFTPVQRDIG